MNIEWTDKYINSGFLYYKALFFAVNFKCYCCLMQNSKHSMFSNNIFKHCRSSSLSSRAIDVGIWRRRTYAEWILEVYRPYAEIPSYSMPNQSLLLDVPGLLLVVLYRFCWRGRVRRRSHGPRRICSSRAVQRWREIWMLGNGLVFPVLLNIFVFHRSFSSKIRWAILFSTSASFLTIQCFTKYWW